MSKTTIIRPLTRCRRFRSAGCRLTGDEYTSVQQSAEALALTVGEYVRFSVISTTRVPPAIRALLEQGEWLRYVLGNFLLHLSTTGQYPTLEALSLAASSGDEVKVEKTEALLAAMFQQLIPASPKLPGNSGVPNA